MSRTIVAMLLAFAAAGTASRCVSAEPAARIATEEFHVPAADNSIRLYLRNKHLASERHFAAQRIVLFVHGATFPCETAFDIDLPGGSWMDFMAARGFDAYCVDVRGYGGSSRPPAMDRPSTESPVFADTKDAHSDVDAAVEFILRRREAQTLNLIGWSWGTTVMASYAAQHPAQVDKLVLFAPVWLMKEAPPYHGAYRTTDAATARATNNRGIPADRVEDISPTAWFEKWWAATLATDPHGAAQSPAVLRSPNGVMKDFNEAWAAGKPTYDPAAIRAATLLIVGEWDVVTPPAMAQEIFGKLTAARDKRMVLLAAGSHALQLQKNRMHLIREVQHFLEEQD